MTKGVVLYSDWRKDRFLTKLVFKRPVNIDSYKSISILYQVWKHVSIAIYILTPITIAVVICTYLPINVIKNSFFEINIYTIQLVSNFATLIKFKSMVNLGVCTYSQQFPKVDFRRTNKKASQISSHKQTKLVIVEIRQIKYSFLEFSCKYHNICFNKVSITKRCNMVNLQLLVKNSQKVNTKGQHMQIQKVI